MAAAIQFASRDEHLHAAAEDAAVEGVYAGEKDAEGRRHGFGQVGFMRFVANAHTACMVDTHSAHRTVHVPQW